MNITELGKSKALITVEITEYMPHSVVSRTILRKSSGNVTVVSFDSGEGLIEKTSPLDTFVQIIDGEADMIIDGKSNLLMTGQSIVIPANATSLINPNGRFKMIQTLI